MLFNLCSLFECYCHINKLRITYWRMRNYMEQRHAALAFPRPTARHVIEAILAHSAPAKPPRDHRDKLTWPRPEEPPCQPTELWRTMLFLPLRLEVFVMQQKLTDTYGSTWITFPPWITQWTGKYCTLRQAYITGTFIYGLNSISHLQHDPKDVTASLTFNSKCCHHVVTVWESDGVNFCFCLLLAGWPWTSFVIPLNLFPCL